MKVRYTWSRYSRNPVEHRTTDGRHAQPDCGQYLHPGWQHVADQPSGLAPLCRRCARLAPVR